MIVLIDAFRLVCEKNTSGHVYVRELALSLVEQDSVSKVILIVPIQPTELIKEYFKHTDGIEFFVQSVSFDPAASWWLHSRWIQIHVAKAVNRIAHNYEKCCKLCFIAPYHQTPIIMSNKIRKLAVIHDLCGLDAESGYKKFSRPYFRHVFNFFTAISFADVLLPISDFTKKEMERYYPNSVSKLTAPAYNSVTTEHLSAEVVAATIAPLSLPLKYFVAFSAMGPRKGTDISILAYQLYKQRGGKHQLLLIGSAAANRYWKDFANSHNVDGITWLTGISDLQRDAIYATAEGLLFPSRCEGFGYPIVEAMRQGCPVIAWKNSPAYEIIQGVQDLLPAIDVNDIAFALEQYDATENTPRDKLSNELIEKSYRFAKSDLGSEFVNALAEPRN